MNEETERLVLRAEKVDYSGMTREDLDSFRIDIRKDTLIREPVYAVSRKDTETDKFWYFIKCRLGMFPDQYLAWGTKAVTSDDPNIIREAIDIITDHIKARKNGDYNTGDLGDRQLTGQGD